MPGMPPAGDATLRRRPVIASDTTLDAIIGGDRQGIITALRGYRAVREKIGWEAYAADNLKGPVRDMLARVLADCRRQGFIRPRVEGDDTLVWDRIVMTKGSKAQPADLCTLCSRECQGRDDVDSGRAKWMRLHDPRYKEARKCWQGSSR